LYKMCNLILKSGDQEVFANTSEDVSNCRVTKSGLYLGSCCRFYVYKCRVEDGAMRIKRIINLKLL